MKKPIKVGISACDEHDKSYLGSRYNTQHKNYFIVM